MTESKWAGSPVPGGSQPVRRIIRGRHHEPLTEKIERNVVISDGGCWIWQGSFYPNGYGQIWANGRFRALHIIAHEEYIGAIPDGWDVGHKCHDLAAVAGLCENVKSCVHRGCCNPDHVKAEPRESNLLASPLTQAAINSSKTHCKRGHEFTPENIRWVGPQKQWRSCRECSRINTQ